ncbi:hypothetical protein ACJIZ3_015668 [Penstemon smallii]|uniref:Uncharacterized protein n=1 Tax=Penstemon smallii TaxID=265156 RepID=A0ABD3RN53_9LAMI
MSGRTTHKKCFPLLANPHANSVNCCAVTTVMLPKLTYTTDLGSFVSSHFKHSGSSFQRLDPIVSSLVLSWTMWFNISWSGPIVWTLWNMEESAETASCSKASKVLRIRDLALGTLLDSWIRKLSMVSSGSVVRMNDGKSLNRMSFLIPGTQSKLVSRRCLYCVYPNNPHALVVQNSTSGNPNLSAASTVKLIHPSETIQLTGGTSPPELLISVSRLQNGSKQVLVNLKRGCDVFIGGTAQ